MTTAGSGAHDGTRPAVAVLLLVRNGERYLDEVLTAVHAELAPAGGRVVAVDSGSSDASVEILARHDVPVTAVPPAAFQHGRTRNLAAGLVPDADLLVYLTQDATPQPGWIDALVSAVRSDPRVAGAFSRQVPRPGCNPLLARRMLEEWPQVGGAERLSKQWLPEADAVAADPARIPHALAHFANTSSCVRRAVWERIPFPEVDFAEDVAWARRALAAGYRIVYEPSSAVWHSHGGSLRRQLLENVDHARGVRRALAADDAARGVRRALAADDDHALMPPRHGALERSRRDLAAIWRADRPVRERVWWTAYAPLWYAASAGGQWVGARIDRWPEWCRERLSWQAVVAGRRGA